MLFDFAQQAGTAFAHGPGHGGVGRVQVQERLLRPQPVARLAEQDQLR